MFNASVLDELLPEVFTIPIDEWNWATVIFVVLAYTGCVVIGSLKGTSKNVAQTIIVLFVLPLLVLISVFNFILRCFGKEPLSLDFLKDFLPWGNEKSKEAETAPEEKSRKQESPARTNASKKNGKRTGHK